MASEDENSKGFKIQDRRRFSAEGDLKPEFSGADEPAAAKPEAPRPGGPPPSAGAHAFAQQQASPTGQQAGASQPQQAAAAKGYAAARSAAAGSHPSQAGAQLDQINFGAFLMSLSTEALLHPREVPDPSSAPDSPL